MLMPSHVREMSGVEADIIKRMGVGAGLQNVTGYPRSMLSEDERPGDEEKEERTEKRKKKRTFVHVCLCCFHQV